ncbi:MAG: NAD(P)-dependent oxidoreductase [Bryobacterales bacterium]|nr:NAD(P)-dependent oxidoreductase [Bryobacterales bacterium]
MNTPWIIAQDDPILVTGAAGFVGSKVVEALLRRGFRDVRCLTRSKGGVHRLEAAVQSRGKGARVDIVCGNLLSPADCVAAVKDISVIYHLAAGAAEKSVPAAFLNSVVTTRNLIEAALGHGRLLRFVNTSSFVVYDLAGKKGRILDESCPVEQRPELFGDAYEFAKVKQDEIVAEYARRFDLPAVFVRPGYVYGPGRPGISGRIGIATFGIFLHLGGPNIVPLTYVDNCADAIVLAGLKSGIEGEVFNIVDDCLPSSRRFLRLYKDNVRPFRSVYLPHALSYLCCLVWERYSSWSQQQLPPAFNRKKWRKFWKGTQYSNHKAKMMLEWQPYVSTREGLRLYFESCRAGE